MSAFFQRLRAYAGIIRSFNGARLVRGGGREHPVGRSWPLCLARRKRCQAQAAVGWLREVAAVRNWDHELHFKALGPFDRCVFVGCRCVFGQWARTP